MKHLLIASLIILLISCHNDEGKSPPSSSESSWEALISTQGCLGGSRNNLNGYHEGSCLAEKPWVDYLSNRSDQKIDFLLERMASTQPTNIHNCAFGNAMEGELAVYILQQLTGKLWFDYSGTNQELLAVVSAYNKAMEEGSLVSDHATLGEILASDSQRGALNEYFKEGHGAKAK